EYVDLRDYFTVRKALDYIRRTGIDKETVYTCFVIDDQRRLVGQVSLRRLIISPEHTTIRDIMDTNIVSAVTTDDQEVVAEDFQRYDLTSIAVTDKENRLVGIITIDDIVDVITEENTEDIKKMAAIIPSDEEYMDAGVLHLVAHRLPWLMIMMLSATLSSSIITHFESVLAGAVVLTAFIPMLTGSAGNSGSQTSVTVIRNMALGEVELSDWLSVLWKEVRVAVVSGAALAGVNMLRMMVFSDAGFMISAVVSITLLVAIVLAASVGCILPMGAKKLGLDPAVMASPMITTIVDAAALLLYFLIATIMLGL
ncbi:MAG: magnesium transporter, partial [Clostridia bacterium]|nr:magnesium transporter [Clostridia bacterium]